MNKNSALTLTSIASLVIAPLAAGKSEPIGVIPFKLDGKLILVEASINHSAPVTLVVDSGASHSVLDPKFAEQLSLTVEKAAPTTGTGAGDVAKSHASPVTITLGALTVDVPQPWVIDLSKVPIPSAAKGLVGAELFKRYVVRMDPVQSTLSVFDPSSYHYEGTGASLPLNVDGDKLFLEANLEVPAGKTVKHKLRIDTGSEGSVNDEIVKQSSEVRTSGGGGGLGNDSKSYSGLFTSVALGPFTIKHVWGSGDPHPGIGMELLRRFIITFDAPHGRLYLEPTPQLAEPVPTPPSE
ncbi:MAG: retropepsin-like domain-containing protein [Verrucomicrobiota bacterium]|nr:retropepsin-like domain-containing protein [Verrucomicrobiota bacterium]